MFFLFIFAGVWIVVGAAYIAVALLRFMLFFAGALLFTFVVIVASLVRPKARA